jgi:hypothetical protein
MYLSSLSLMRVHPPVRAQNAACTVEYGPTNCKGFFVFLLTLYIHIVTYSVRLLNISTLCEVKTFLLYIYKETCNKYQYFLNIKFEHGIYLI